MGSCVVPISKQLTTYQQLQLHSPICIQFAGPLVSKLEYIPYSMDVMRSLIPPLTHSATPPRHTTQHHATPHHCITPHLTTPHNTTPHHNKHHTTHDIPHTTHHTSPYTQHHTTQHTNPHHDIEAITAIVVTNMYV